jgi:hypothetical protein
VSQTANASSRAVLAAMRFPPEQTTSRVWAVQSQALVLFILLLPVLSLFTGGMKDSGV